MLQFQTVCACLCKDIKVKPKEMQATLLIHQIEKKKRKKNSSVKQKNQTTPKGKKS